MIVLVKKPDQSICEIEVTPKSLGQECLDQVCQKLGTIEGDYFGLQFTRKNVSDPMWLNLRNPINSQVTGSSPLRLQLRVKFHVQPHLILQEVTRRLFFLDLKLDLVNSKLIASVKETARLAALLAQAEQGNYSPHAQHYASLPDACCNADFITQVMAEHMRLRGMKPAQAEYQFLKEVASLDSYGVELFEAKDASGRGVLFGVGPQHIHLFSTEPKMECLERIGLDLILKESLNGKCFSVTYPEETNGELSPVTMSVKLQSKEAAEALYRAITEKHEFFVCDTVQKRIRAECVRDFKGTLASIFTENTEYGKKFMFDVQRTWKEVYDQTRRTLHRAGTAGVTGRPFTNLAEREDAACAMTGVDEESEVKLLRNKVEMYNSGLSCKVCMATRLDTAFLPCGHVLCQVCAEQVEVCPHCRGEIQERLRIFLPIDDCQIEV
ncbi:E3 ubiquitin-protein ligase MYLIP-A-like [Acanthaster planci]|uniref:E3 ubiquitin-protein ligase MYLIP-A-like n=1 Tax=Acanthaster planci TaxID=133434 RepID=A0A8B7YMJ2_ACAPL|nr:E3 ubiquitin-protein ligase MYLIP-A-like [Acanthaster planci]